LTTLALRRADGFFWVQVAGAALLWLVAWFAALPVATWVAYDLLGLEPGTPVGSGLAFMMAVTALSLPEMIILRRVMKPRLIAVFVAIVASGIVAVGYLFNFLAA
jgi:uncharacterized membrane protein YraQ (UPF0718 family)